MPQTPTKKRRRSIGLKNKPINPITINHVTRGGHAHAFVSAAVILSAQRDRHLAIINLEQEGKAL
jgi:hypothetical protein